MPRELQSPVEDDEALIERALAAATDTRSLVVRPGVRHAAASMFGGQFGARPAIVVADQNTFAAAGRDVWQSLKNAGHAAAEPFLFGPDVYAEDCCVRQLEQALAAVEAVPLAVGSGTINDLTKLAAHRLGRPCIVVATAASMDGYTAYGASITAYGSKRTFACPDHREKLKRQLISLATVCSMLEQDGCPFEPEQIGISRELLRMSYWQALFLRRRFTVLDLAHRTGLLEQSLDRLFGPAGPWPVRP